VLLSASNANTANATACGAKESQVGSQLEGPNQFVVRSRSDGALLARKKKNVKTDENKYSGRKITENLGNVTVRGEKRWKE
jgi:hypothetical protein